MSLSTRVSFSGFVLLSTLATAALLVVPVTGSTELQDAGQESTPAKDPLETQLDEVRTLSRNGLSEEAKKAADILQQIPFDKLTETQQDTWISLARDNALQLGDLGRLKELGEKQTTFPSDKIYEVLLAYGKLTRAEVDESKKILAAINTDELNPREERRVFALQAKIARLEGNAEAEREAIEKMIGHLPYWTESRCQACHNDLKNPDRMTSVSFKDLWFGERYSELMKSKGDADAVRQKAEERLGKDPADILSLVQLGYALKSLGDHDGAQKAFQRISFSKESGNDLSSPRMLFSFP
ncbi:MAG: hypothetical protein JNM43_07055 [Planctomycetaceae bacterium]|nr:hypothetical protein [Planctomycetaceae bacterium]